MTLVLRSHFPEPPAESLIAAFQHHVRTTGQPETFHAISTTPPPEDGAIEVLLEKININKKLRPLGDRAPCPICSPTSPKYLSDGTLIWCAHTESIYAIGPKCSLSIWTDNRLQTAKNVFRRSQKEREEAAALFHHVRRADAFLQWIADHQGRASAAEQVHREFGRSMKTLRLALSRDIKTRGAVLRSSSGRALAWIRGPAFLTGSWSMSRELSEAALGIRRAATEAGADPQAWAEALAPTARRDKLKEIRAARQVLVRSAERMSAAALFLSQGNIEPLAIWSKSEVSPIRFDVSHTGTKIEFRQGSDRWVGPLGLAMPDAVP